MGRRRRRDQSAIQARSERRSLGSRGRLDPRGGELADERITIVDLPAVPADAILELRLVGPGEAVVRVFQAEARDAAARDRAALRWDDEERSESLRSSTYVPWSLLDPLEKDRRLAHRWLRLPALGEDGVDFSTRTVFVSDFRTRHLGADTEGTEVSRDRAAVVNVMGPTRLTIEPPLASRGPFRVDTIGTTRQTWSSTGGALAVDIAEGATSVILSAESTTPGIFRILGDHERWIASVERRASTPRELIVPTRVRIPMVVIGPTATATVPIYQLDEVGVLGRILRVDARLLEGPDLPAHEPLRSATITVTFRARDGKQLGHYEVPVDARQALFERLDWAGANRPVSEASTFRVIAPTGFARVELRADRDVAVSLARWLPGPVEREQPYTSPPSADLTWRYAPLVHRSWFAALPDNHEQLVLARRTAQLEAQVRIDAIDPVARLGAITAAPPLAAAVGPPVYETVRLTGTEQQRAREPITEASDQMIREWAPGSLTELHPRQPRRLDFRATLRTRPRLMWTVANPALGSAAAVTIGGTTLTVPLETSTGSAELPAIPAGVHRVIIAAKAGVKLWVNRPPVDDQLGLYRDRTLYAVGRRPVSFMITQAPGEQVHLYAIIYAPDAATTPRVRLTLDRGKPRRRVGVVTSLTVAEVIRDLPPARGPAARLVDLGGRSAGTPRLVHFGLLDDLSPGQHRIDVAALTGPALWIRVIATRTPPGGSPASFVPLDGARTANDDE